MSEQLLSDLEKKMMVELAQVGETVEDAGHWHWSNWRVILIITNAALGLACFEWAWYKMRLYRKPIKELDDMLPAFRRTDADRWSKWKFYPGAVTIMLPRLFFGIAICTLLCLYLFICLLGQPMDQPIRGCRRVFLRWGYRFTTFLFQLLTNFNFMTWKHMSMQEVNHYEEWLGPREEQEKEQFDHNTEVNGAGTLFENGSTDFSDKQPASFATSPSGQAPNSARQQRRIPKRGRGPPSTIICNHLGWCEVVGLIMSPLHPGFTPKIDLIKVPLLGTACRGLQSLFVDRGSDQESRDRVVQQIVNRQKAIEEDCETYNPMCIFAEGTTTNGQGLMKFKRGAFVGLRTVIPCYVSFGKRYLMPTYDSVSFWPFVFLYFSSLCMHNMKLTIMPEFKPTQWMLDNHQAKGSADWEIFAECVREAIAKQGNFFKEDRPARDKMAYEDFMKGNTDTMTLDGRTWTRSNSQDDGEYHPPQVEVDIEAKPSEQ